MLCCFFYVCFCKTLVVCQCVYAAVELATSFVAALEASSLYYMLLWNLIVYVFPGNCVPVHWKRLGPPDSRLISMLLSSPLEKTIGSAALAFRVVFPLAVLCSCTACTSVAYMLCFSGTRSEAIQLLAWLLMEGTSSSPMATSAI